MYVYKYVCIYIYKIDRVGRETLSEVGEGDRVHLDERLGRETPSKRNGRRS